MKNITKKIKQIFVKENASKIILGILILVFLVLASIYFIGTKNISSIEKKQIIYDTNKYIYFADDLLNKSEKEEDNYILFSLDYNYANNNSYEMTSDEIYNFIKNSFTKRISKDNIKNNGISPLLMDNKITYDASSDKYKIDKISANKLAKKELVYYKLKSIRRINNKKYTIKYDKYVIRDPYKMLNYYIDKNNNNNMKNGEFQDITPITDYLKGSTNKKAIKEIINKHEDDLKNYSKKDGNIKITYIINDKNETKIDNIR